MSNEINTGDFSYSVIRSRRKTMSLEVHRDGRILIRAPLKISEIRIRKFVEQKRQWVLHTLERVKIYEEQQDQIPQYSQEEKDHYRKKAAEVFTKRCQYYADIMGVSYNRITIREQKTRWGSCSTGRNLNFNWKLIFAPQEVLDYVVVHELSHLTEMNHSSAFWAQVEKIMPDYEAYKKWLKDNGWKLISI